MDIHRCRFIEYAPAAINAIAFSRPSASEESIPLRLAVGRANGNIEIYDPRQGLWIHETTCFGGRDRSVEGLAWTRDSNEEGGRLRLFSIGYSSTVTEWDLCTGLPLRQSGGGQSEIWCLAAQPKVQEKNSAEEQAQDLIVGCADGTLALLSTADGDLSFSKYVSRAPKKNARALSVAFQDRNTVIAGYSDSMMRVFNIRNNNLIRTISLGGGPAGGPKDTLVWTIECLKDGTFVSGDSFGEVTLWDGKTYGQLQKIAVHEADVLCLTSSQDGKTLFSGGIDRRMAMFSAQTSQAGITSWKKSAHRRLHKHDMKALASYEDASMSVVVSGGLDASLVLTPLSEFGQEYHRKLPFIPQQPPLTAAGRLVVSWSTHEIAVWRLLQRRVSIDDTATDKQRNYKKVAHLVLKGDENITSATISPDGNLLAVATAAELKVFQLSSRSNSSQDILQVQKLNVPASLATLSGRLVAFSPDSRWLICVGARNTIRAASLSHNGFAGICKLRRIKRDTEGHDGLNGDWGAYSRTITKAAFSSDSKILAIADLAGYVDSWVLRDSSDESSSDSSSSSSSSSPSRARETPTNEQWKRNRKARRFPRLPSQPLILSFRPADPQTSKQAKAHDHLLVLTATHELQEYHILKGRLTSWSRRNPSSLLPAKFKLQRDRAMGCLWDVQPAVEPGDGAKPKHRARVRAWIFGATWLCAFDLDKDFAHEQPDLQDDATTINGKRHTGEKRRHSSRGGGSEDGETAQEKLRSKRRATKGGAGSKISPREAQARVSKSTARVLEPVSTAAEEQVDDVGRREWVDDGASDDEDEEDDDDDGEAVDARIAEYRRTGKRDADSASKDDEDVDDDDEEEEQGDDGALDSGHDGLQDGASSSFYLTHRYRPILGIVPLAPATSDEPNKGKPKPLEVALVERPLWDLDLPGRFVGASDARN